MVYSVRATVRSFCMSCPSAEYTLVRFLALPLWLRATPSSLSPHVIGTHSPRRLSWMLVHQVKELILRIFSSLLSFVDTSFLFTIPAPLQRPRPRLQWSSGWATHCLDGPWRGRLLWAGLETNPQWLPAPWIFHDHDLCHEAPSRRPLGDCPHSLSSVSAVYLQGESEEERERRKEKEK